MPSPQGLTQELAVLRNGAMWRGLLLTVIGFAGVFTLYTYIEPLLTQITGMDNRMIAFTLLLFGAGLALGNHAGGKLADRFGVQRALWVSLAALMLVLIAGRWMFASTPLAIAFVLLLGIAAFATVAPLQMGVLQSAGEAGMNLASSLNIAAFNLGNALGAWLGGAVIAQGLGLTWLAWAAAMPQQRRCSWPASRHVRPVQFRLRPWRRACTEAQTPRQGGTRHKGGSLPCSSADEFHSKATSRSPFLLCSSSAWFLHQFRSHGRHELFAGPHARFCTAVHQFRA
jgi:DHA1 family inner membrane transport protein